MLRLSRKVLFAIEAVLDIAYHAGSTPVQSGEISRRQGIPRRYLEHALQNLVRHGVLAGIRGPRGGYLLARERRKITLGEIVRIVGEIDGDEDAMTAGSGSPLCRLVIAPLWQELRGEMLTRLDAVTLDALCRSASDAGIASEGHAVLDFSI